MHCIDLSFPLFFRYTFWKIHFHISIVCTFWDALFTNKSFMSPLATHISAFYLFLKDSNIGQVSVGYGLEKPLQHTVSKYTPPPDPTPPPTPPHPIARWHGWLDLCLVTRVGAPLTEAPKPLPVTGRLRRNREKGGEVVETVMCQICDILLVVLVEYP